MTAYQVVYWAPVIKQDNRNSRNLSDGPIFRSPEDAERFAKGILGGGGKVLHINVIENAHGWLESLEEWNRVPAMSSRELADIGARR